jgi:AFG3 family protein
MIQLIDTEIKRIVDECEKRTFDLITEKKVLIQKLSDRLLEKETIDLNEILKVLGPRPFEPKSSFKAFLEEITKSEIEKTEKTEKSA